MNGGLRRYKKGAICILIAWGLSHDEASQDTNLLKKSQLQDKVEKNEMNKMKWSRLAIFLPYLQPTVGRRASLL